MRITKAKYLFSYLKKPLRRFRFFVGARAALRGLLVDVKTVVWIISRRRKIERYVKSHKIKKLQIGTSKTPIDGWLNSDLTPKRGDIVYLDATRRFPFSDHMFDYVACEHMIEHITYANASMMLSECCRVLKPGGRIRIATPDFEVLIGLYRLEPESVQRRFVDFSIAKNWPTVRSCKEVFVINNAFRAWGHTFLYDRATLQTILLDAGFNGIVFYKSGVSDDPHLQCLEKHGQVIGSEEMNQFITVVAEGLKPLLHSGR